MKKYFFKFLKGFFFFLLGIILVVNIFILLSGRFYLYKGVANTYLIGKAGPSIYDLDVFYNRTVHKNGAAEEPLYHSKYNTTSLNKQDRAFVESLDTRALLVYKGDSLIYEEYWDQHNKGQVSNSFSVAKTLVALLIGIAVDEGKIKSLDEPVANYIKKFKEGGREKITIRQLLQMSSGLDWEESGKNPLSDNAESYYGTDLYGLVTRQRIITNPGSEFLYQSGNSQLLSFILNKATGKSTSKYAEEKIWSRIGMTGDAFWNLDKEGGDEKAFCCLYANARDYGKLGLLLENEGKYKEKQIIPEWYYKEMIANPEGMGTEEGVKNTRYGLHIWTYSGGDSPVYYCRGINGQYIITIPKENLTIIRLGEKKLKNFEIPKNKEGNLRWIKENEAKIGHSLGLFKYIALGKSIASQIK
jgi:CubicO group peptidase (beta-lactamase class C family)